MLISSVLTTKTVCRLFHTSSPRHVHPIIWVFLKPVLKGVAFLTGRSTRKWYQGLPPEKRSILMSHLDRHKFKYLGIIGTLGTAAGIHYYTHLETAPITGRRRYIMLNSHQLEVLSDLEKEKIASMFRDEMLNEKSKQTQLVARVAKKVITSNMDVPEIRRIKWTVRVVDTDMKNAFVLPSGDIYATRGMLETMTNEDQLAIILSHELSHAILGHSGERISYLQLIDVLAIFGAFIIWAVFPTDWTSFWVNFIFENFMTFTSRLPYSRSLEEEADVVGLLLAAKACYDVRESVNFWQTVQLHEDQTEIPEFLSTHPSNATRAEHLKEKLPWALDIRQQCKCYPLPANKPLGALDFSKHPEEKIMEPITKRVSKFPHIPVVETINEK